MLGTHSARLPGEQVTLVTGEFSATAPLGWARSGCVDAPGKQQCALYSPSQKRVIRHESAPARTTQVCHSTRTAHDTHSVSECTSVTRAATQTAVHTNTELSAQLCRSLCSARPPPPLPAIPGVHRAHLELWRGLGAWTPQANSSAHYTPRRKKESSVMRARQHERHRCATALALRMTHTVFHLLTHSPTHPLTHSSTHQPTNQPIYLSLYLTGHFLAIRV